MRGAARLTTRLICSGAARAFAACRLRVGTTTNPLSPDRVRQVEPPLVATMNSLSGYRVIRVTALSWGGHGRRQTIEDIEAD